MNSSTLESGRMYDHATIGKVKLLLSTPDVCGRVVIVDENDNYRLTYHRSLINLPTVLDVLGPELGTSIDVDRALHQLNIDPNEEWPRG